MKTIVIIILVLLLGTSLGYYLGFDQGWEKSIRQSNQNQNTEILPVSNSENNDTLEPAPNVQVNSTPFQKSDRLGFYGTLTLTGYVDMETRVCNPGDMCEKTVEYANFLFTNEPDPTLKEFLGQNQGNSFVGTPAVGIGCYEPDRQRIFYENFGDESNIQGTITGTDLENLLASNIQNQVRLQLTRPIYTSGRGAPDCYSHFRDFDVLN